MILVVGGTGMLGSRVAAGLLSRGERVRVMTRDETQNAAVRLAAAGAEVLKGDLRDRDSVHKALEGVSAVVASVQALAGPKSKGKNNPSTVDENGTRTLIDAMGVAGVSRLVYVSVFGASPDVPSPLWTVKYWNEEYLKTTSLDYVIVRPGPFMEMWGTLIGDPIVSRHKATVFGDGSNPVNFVSADDVAAFIVAVLADPSASRETIDIGGPENLSLDDVVRVYESVVGTRAKVTHIPVTAMRVMSKVMGLFNPALGRQIGAGACMATIPHTCDTSATAARFGVTLTTMSEIARRGTSTA